MFDGAEPRNGLIEKIDGMEPVAAAGRAVEGL